MFGSRGPAWGNAIHWAKCVQCGKSVKDWTTEAGVCRDCQSKPCPACGHTIDGHFHVENREVTA